MAIYHVRSTRERQHAPPPHPTPTPTHTRDLSSVATCHVVSDPRDLSNMAIYPVRSTRNVNMPPHPTPTPRQRAILKKRSKTHVRFSRRRHIHHIYTQCISIDCGCVKKWMSSQEPLRILIFFFLSICGFSAPGFAPSNAAHWYFAVALVFAAVFGFLFLRERGKRTAQLVRLETWVGNGCGMLGMIKI